VRTLLTPTERLIGILKRNFSRRCKAGFVGGGTFVDVKTSLVLKIDRAMLYQLDFASMAAAASLDFWNYKFVTVGRVMSVEFHHRAKFRDYQSNRCRDIAICYFFPDGGRRHLTFMKFGIFNYRSRAECRTASSCQISSKSLEPRPRYGDFSI